MRPLGDPYLLWCQEIILHEPLLRLLINFAELCP